MQQFNRTLPARALATCRGRRLTAAVLAGLAAASLSGSALAQCDTYTIAAGPAAFIAGDTPAGIVGDDVTGTVTLPFDITVYGATYFAGSAIGVGSNGFVSLNSLNPGLGNVCLPRTTGTNYGPVLYPHWDDLRTDLTAGGIWTGVSGTAPNRTFVIEWQAVYYAANTTALNFEVQFHESSTDIDFVYNSIPNTGVSATIGVEFQNTGPSTQWSCNTAGGVTDGMSLRLTCGALVPGACCANDGSCSLVTQTNCATPSTWNGGSACSPNPCPQPSANDNCSTAEVITATPFAGSVPATPNNDDVDVACNAAANVATRSGVWYQFTSTAEGGRLTLGETGPNDVVIGVFGGFDCNGLSEMACFDAEANDIVDLPGNTTVWILVGMWSTATVPTGTYNLTANYAAFVPGACCNPDGSCSITTINLCTTPSTWNGGASCEPNPCPQPPANDNCSNAEVATVGTYSGDNSTASTDGSATCGYENGGKKDVWYSFTAPSSHQIRFDTVGSAQSDTVLALFDGCGGTQLACNDDGPGIGLKSLIDYGMTNGQTAYVRVASYGLTPAGGGYNLNIAAIGSGACCGNTTGACNITSSSACTGANTYLGDNTTCDASPCGTPGACCSGTGTCTLLLSSACTGYYIGDGTVCNPDTCVLGACCLSSGCIQTNAADCTSQGGTFAGAGIVCSGANVTGTLFSSGDAFPITIPDTTPAGVTASIVIPAGSGTVSGLSVAVDLTHTWVGDLIVTISNGSTTVSLINRPGSVGGSFGYSTDVGGQYVFTDAASTPFAVAAATGPALAAGSYQPASPLSAFDGAPFEGTWTLTVSDNAGGDTGTVNALSFVSVAITNACGSSGACCAGSTCSVTDSASCTGANTSYAGDNTVCNAPGNNTAPCCKADYNHSGTVTVQDIFDFLGAYFTQNPQADINTSGTVTVQDIFDFLGAYFTGCN